MRHVAKIHEIVPAALPITTRLAERRFFHMTACRICQAQILKYLIIDQTLPRESRKYMESFSMKTVLKMAAVRSETVASQGVSASFG
jgi:hypothetical protein